MRRYEERPVVRATRIQIEARCDRCGRLEEPGAMGRLVPVVISINEGEEMGHRTELDYCDDCLVALADHFVAAGSKAPYVTGEELPFDDDADD